MSRRTSDLDNLSVHACIDPVPGSFLIRSETGTGAVRGGVDRDVGSRQLELRSREGRGGKRKQRATGREIMIDCMTETEEWSGQSKEARFLKTVGWLAEKLDVRKMRSGIIDLRGQNGLTM